jgi:hypothetical protein
MNELYLYMQKERSGVLSAFSPIVFVLSGKCLQWREISVGARIGEKWTPGTPTVSH